MIATLTLLAHALGTRPLARRVWFQNNKPVQLALNKHEDDMG
jgi:hypothetical protein